MYLIFNDKNILEYCSKSRPKDKIYIEANSDYDPSRKYKLENDKLVDITDEYIIKSMQTDEYIDELISSKYKQRFNDAEAFSTLSVFLLENVPNLKLNSEIKKVVETVYIDKKSITNILDNKKYEKYYLEFKKIFKVSIRKYWVKLIFDERNRSIKENRKPNYYPYLTDDFIFKIKTPVDEIIEEKVKAF